MRRLLASLLLGVVVACSGAKPERAAAPPAAPRKAAPLAAADPEPWRSQKPAPGARADLAYPVPDVVRLPSGLTLYVVPRKAGILELKLVVRHGASSVPQGKSGLAGLTARMLTEGTRQKSSLALAEAVESLGTTLQADAGRDYSSVELSTLTQDADRGLALLAEVVQAPSFSAKEFTRVRGEWLDGLLAERQEPQRLASLVALRLLLGDVQGAPVSGSVPDVKALTVKDLRDFHRQHYTPDSAALILVGDMTLADAKLRVERSFGAWKAAAPAASVAFAPPAPPTKTRIVLVDRPDAVQTALFVVQPFPKRNVAGHEARELLSNLLGGLFTSRINQNLREKHAFTYGARSSLLATRLWGAFAVSTSVRTDVTAPALEQLELEIRALSEPKSARPIQRDELARSKADLVNRLGAHLEHTSRIAEDLASSFVQGLPTDYASRYAPLVESLPIEAVAREAQRLTPKQLLIVAVGDRKQIEPELEKRGHTLEIAAEKLLE